MPPLSELRLWHAPCHAPVCVVRASRALVRVVELDAHAPEALVLFLAQQLHVQLLTQKRLHRCRVHGADHAVAEAAPVKERLVVERARRRALLLPAAAAPAAAAEAQAGPAALRSEHARRERRGARGHCCQREERQHGAA